MVYLERILKACAQVGIEGSLVDVEGDDAGDAGARARPRRSSASTTTRRSPGSSSRCRCPTGVRLRTVVDAIDPLKDIDGIHPLNAGLLRLGYEGFIPATAHAALEMIHRSGVEVAGRRRRRHRPLAGRRACRSRSCSTKEDATVTVCHSKTRDLAAKVAPGRHRRRRGRACPAS